jgi:hypothetical protein
MASVNVILGLIIVLGIIYMYINSRQYLVREGFYVEFDMAKWKQGECMKTEDGKLCHPRCYMTKTTPINGTYMSTTYCDKETDPCRKYSTLCKRPMPPRSSIMRGPPMMMRGPPNMIQGIPIMQGPPMMQGLPMIQGQPI